MGDPGLVLSIFANALGGSVTRTAAQWIHRTKWPVSGFRLQGGSAEWSFVYGARLGVATWSRRWLPIVAALPVFLW